ncbi:PEGA domain-containing protein, partial [bacterium]|nr:PEGA domain-containing protein [bacterium]
AIAFATVILVYIGSGFYVDRQTGSLIQNGQIIVNSDPEGARVYVNDKQQRAKTSGKLVLPSGAYSVSFKKDNYRDWNQQVTLDGGIVQRLDYARLIPKELSTSIAQTFSSAPSDISQSPDRRWITLAFADQPKQFYLYDLTQPEEAPKAIAIDASLYVDANKIGYLVVSEWSDDNKTMLLENRYNGAVQDYFLLNKDNTLLAKNLTRLYGVPGVVISLSERSNDRFFVYNPATKVLNTATVATSILTSRLTEVLEFRTLNENTILYTTLVVASQGKVQVRITDGLEKSYLVREISQDGPHLLGISKYGSNTTVAVGATKDNKVAIFKNPVGYFKSNPTKTLPLAVAMFALNEPSEVSFSTDGSVVMARGGQRIASYYFEENKSSRFDIAQPISAQKLRWADGKHLQYVSNGFAYITDFDGANTQQLMETNELFSVNFDNTYRYLYSFSKTTKPFNISRTLIKLNN